MTMLGLFRAVAPLVLDGIVMIATQPRDSDTRPSPGAAASAVPSTQDAPATVGCPYCATARALASVNMYLVRGSGGEQDYRDLYRNLALKEIGHAHTALDGIGGVPDMDTMKLALAVTTLEGRLSGAVPSAADMQAAARAVWQEMGNALTLAERFNSVDTHTATVITELERRADGPIIEGEIVSEEYVR